MLRILALLAALLCFAVPAKAQSVADVISGCGSITVDSGKPHNMTEDTTGSHCVTAIQSSQYPSGATVLAGNATGSTGAVVGTLAAASGKTTYICGFTVSALGTANTVGPITVAGLIGASQVYQASTLATGVAQQIGQTFSPCIPASATNTAITVTTTAAAGGTAVDVNSWGYRF